jgi:hypothetical protein
MTTMIVIVFCIGLALLLAYLSRAGFNSRSAKRHRASQFGGAKSISALAPDRETQQKIKFFCTGASKFPNRNCGLQSICCIIVTELGNVPKRDRDATCAQRRRRFLFAPVLRGDGYPVSARRRIHAR